MEYSILHVCLSALFFETFVYCFSASFIHKNNRHELTLICKRRQNA